MIISAIHVITAGSEWFGLDQVLKIFFRCFFFLFLQYSYDTIYLLILYQLILNGLRIATRAAVFSVQALVDARLAKIMATRRHKTLFDKCETYRALIFFIKRLNLNYLKILANSLSNFRISDLFDQLDYVRELIKRYQDRPLFPSFRNLQLIYC